MRKQENQGWSIALTTWLILVVFYHLNSEEKLPLTEKPEVQKVSVANSQSQPIVMPPPPPMPKSAVRPAPLSISTPVQKFESKSEPLDKSIANSMTNPVSNRNNQSSIAIGRFWLSQLEHGKGPNIVINWPIIPAQRKWLQNRLYRCGVRLGRWSNGRLTAIEPGVNVASGFMRVFNGELSVNEEMRLSRLSGQGQPVRLFPRALDVTLLSGFHKVAPTSFANAKEVVGRYEKKGEAVIVNDLKIDDQQVKTSILLLPSTGECA